jgi:hypothetical protein
MKSVNIRGYARSSKGNTFNPELIILSIGSFQYALSFAILSEDECSFYVMLSLWSTIRMQTAIARGVGFEPLSQRRGFLP